MAPISVISTLTHTILHHFSRQDTPSDIEEDHHHSSDCTGVCLRNWKIIFAVLLFAEGLLFGHLVLLLRRQTYKSQQTFANVTRFGHALSAGVFFATGLLHILPEAIEIMSGEGHEEHEGEGEEEEGVSFPWPFFTVVVGFYGLFFIEKILIPKLFGRVSSHATDIEKNIKADVKQVLQTRNDKGSSSGTPSDIVNEGVCCTEGCTGLDESKEGRNYDLKSAVKITEESGMESSAPFELETRFASRAFAVAIIQIVGLSVHSLFESISLGLSSDFSTVLNVFIATAAHRWATSVAIAFTCAAELAYTPFVTVFLLFSVMVPVGIGIGAGLQQLNTTVQGVIFALSAATFIYIGAFETMAEEFVIDQKWIGRKFIATLTGAAIIIIVTGILVSLDVHG